MLKYLLLLSIIISSCCSMITGMETGNDNFQNFILSELQKYGAKQKKPTVSLSHGYSWKYREDNNGVVIDLKGNHYKEIDNFFKSMYGTPFMVTKNEENNPYSTIYGIKAAGAKISYSTYSDNVTSIIIIKADALP